MPFYRAEENDLDFADGVDFAPDDVPRAVVAVGGYMVTKGMELAKHEHRKAELILTLRGVVRCEADQGVWIVPPRCAVWIPDNVPHSVTFAGNVEVYVLLSPLLERLLLHATQMPILYDVDGADGRIATVLLDQLSVAPVETLNFPMPVDARLRKIAAAMMADPSDRATIDDWGRRMAVAPRTLTRALKRETGMSFGRWRQQLHILIALKRLDQGASVQAVAFDLGYEGASAFVTMFRKALGKPPARYLAERRIAT
jgi:AraC-like DNA-binding protein/quercetin dioxygenase-like cupin family protein